MSDTNDTFYEGYDPPASTTIWAVGETPVDAIKALVDARNWGEFELGSELTGGDPAYTWGYRFWAGGCSFKAAGVHIAGGVLLTWWK